MRGGGNKNITDLWGEGKFFGEFYSDTIKILQKKPPLPPSVNDDQFPKHVFFFNFMSQP